MRAVLLLLIITVLLTACAKRGSDRWCKKMEKKPQSEWSMEDARDYLEHCAFRDLDLSP